MKSPFSLSSAKSQFNFSKRAMRKKCTQCDFEPIYPRERESSIHLLRNLNTNYLKNILPLAKLVSFLVLHLRVEPGVLPPANQFPPDPGHLSLVGLFVAPAELDHCLYTNCANCAAMTCILLFDPIVISARLPFGTASC